MEMGSLWFGSCFSVCLVVVSVVLLPSCSRGVPKHAALFIFGDSLLDAGNNNYINTTASFKANFSPYGETFFKFPTGRFSDGRLIPDFLAEYATLPLIHPYLDPKNKDYLYGVNFASAGAGVLVDTFQGSVIDLKTQLSYFNKVAKAVFKELGHAEAKPLLSRAVYFISIGSSDYILPFIANSSLFQSRTPHEYVHLVIGNLTSVIKGIHKNGGRKFAILSLGYLGCLPTVKAVLLKGKDECLEEITELVKLHNEHLYKTLLVLEKELEGFVYSYGDIFSISVEVTSNPAKYGFKEAKMACCGSGPFRGYYSCGGRFGLQYEVCDNPTQHLFFDESHPTEKWNQLFAELLWNGTSRSIRPSNLKALFHI